MNKSLVLLLVTASLAASGCVGFPEGAARDGDLVTIDWIARDPATGEVLRQGTGLSFAVGSGDSGLGSSLEHSLVGHGANDTYTFVSENDPTRDYTDEVRASAFLGRSPAENVVDLATYEEQIQANPQVGDLFDFNPIYRAEVVDISDGNLTYRFYIPDGEQRDDAGVVGAILVTRIEGDQLVRELEPDVGATFTIQPASPFAPAPLGLAAGNYRTVGIEDGQLVYSYTTAAYPELVGVPVEFEITVHAVASSAGGAQELEGNYGARHSPYVNGDPTSVLGDDHAHGDAEADQGDDHADDGHTH